MVTAQKLLTPEEIAAQGTSEIPFLRLPTRGSLFSDRASRLRQLASGHSMGDYLLFIAKIAEAQQQTLDNMPSVPLPSPSILQQCWDHGTPPLNAQSHQRDRIWCDVLRRMLRRLSDETDAKLRDTIVRLEGERDEYYEAQASKLLAGITLGLNTATAPFIGAALQIYWTHMVTTLGLDAFHRIDVETVCLCCGQRPTASIARIGGQESGYRFLHCSLCAAEWHMVRIKCTQCKSTKGIHYQSVDDGRPSDKHAVKAECCDECGTYLKILYMDRDYQVEPIADDLTTLPLDLLVTESLGKRSSGVNLMLIHGDPGDS